MHPNTHGSVTTIEKIWKQPKCPFMDVRTQKTWRTHTVVIT